jgi:hypothetical protein
VLIVASHPSGPQIQWPTPDHRTGRDGAAGVGKGELEQEERQERNAGRAVGGGRAVQEEVRVPDPTVACSEHEREAERPEQDAAQTRVGDALEHDVRDFTRPSEPGFQHHEAGLHEEHQERRHQHPHRVEGVDDVVGFQRRSRLAEHRCSGLGTEVPGDRPKAQHHGAEPEHLSA